MTLAWQNDDLILFHGCTNVSLYPQNPSGIRVGSLPHGIDYRAGAKRPDFGPGFYATTWLHQAKNWANLRVRKESRKHHNVVAIVLRLAMKRNDLADLEDVVFLTDRGDYFPFVGYCRRGGTPHAPVANRQRPYDIIYGPVSTVGQSHTLKDCDQVSFHTTVATSKIPIVTIEAQGNPLFKDVIP
jgi:Protein of unknown function (DUF3990)